MVRNLKMLREKKGISQAQLGRMLGVTQQTVNKYENYTTEPDIATLERLAEYFNTSVDYLVGNTDIERKYEVVYKCDLSASEMAVMEEYRSAEDSGKEIIHAILREFNKNRN